MPRSPRALLLGAATCALLFVVLLVLAYASARARSLDASALQGFFQGPAEGRATIAERIAAVGDPLPVALIGAGLAALALARARPRVGLAVVALLAVTSVSSQLLKAFLAYPRHVEGVPNLGPEAFPSGHCTAVMTLALCAVLVCPPRLRPLAAVAGAGFALAVAFSVIALGWHFASDVVGGFLLATGWALAAAAVLVAAERRWPERPGRLALQARAVVDRVAAVGLVAALLVGMGLLVGMALLVTRSADVVDFAAAHTAAVVVGSGVVGAAAVLLGVVTAALRRGS